MARIIITGASDGIGAEMARQLAQTHGSRLQLTLAARNAGNLQPWQSNAGPWGRRCWKCPPM
jgi:short-subunit dehydrogenase